MRFNVLIRTNNVKLLMARRNIGQGALGRWMGISHGYMSELMTGAKNPSGKVRAKLQGYFEDVDFDTLFEIEELEER